MAFRVKETTRRGGNGSSSASNDGARKAKRTFTVEYDADTPPAGPWAAETANDGTTAIPALDSTLPGDTSRICTEISAKPRGDTGLLFDVEVTYEKPAVGEFLENPLAAPADFDWDFSASSQPYFKDESSPVKRCTTSAGEPFENLLQREVGEIVVTITQNIAPSAWNPILAASYMRPATATNDGPITIEGAMVGTGQARFGGIKCSGIKTSNGINYRTRTIVLKLSSSWDHIVEDRGFHESDGSGKLREITKGTPPVKVEKPWPLNGSGAKKAAVDDPPAEIELRPYPRRDFDIWGIS